MRLGTLLIAFLSINIVAFAQLKNINYYGGLNFSTISAKDFDKFDISDWQNYGLKQVDPSSAEGRVNINLGQKKPATANLGIMIGSNYELNESLEALLELQYNFSGLDLYAANIGINYKVINAEKFSLGITAKAGYVSGSADLGVIEMISGYTPPVILPEGTFNVGDKLTMEFSGITASVGLAPQFIINEQISVVSFVGYNLSFAKSDGLKCNDILLPMEAKGVVKADLGKSPANLKPEVNTSGINAFVGVKYTLPTTSN